MSHKGKVLENISWEAESMERLPKVIDCLSSNLFIKGEFEDLARRRANERPFLVLVS